jgi:hypothetical protein
VWDTTSSPEWVKRYRVGAHREPLNVRFAPKATESLRRRERPTADGRLIYTWVKSSATAAARPCIPQARSVPAADHTFFTGGIVHVPSMIEGALSSGQYMRSIRMNFPAGAGSQFDSLSAPGESFWI